MSPNNLRCRIQVASFASFIVLGSVVGCEGSTSTNVDTGVDGGGGASSGDRTVFANDTTKVVAEAKGGFEGPGSAGSECAPGSATYTLTPSSLTLDSKQCENDDARLSDGGIAPYLLKGRTLTLSQDQYAPIKTALSNVAPSTSNECGLDKPMLQITVSSITGSTVYLDDFYSCNGSGDYVSGLDAVFDAFAKITRD